jgi:hypothetical protein
MEGPNPIRPGGGLSVTREEALWAIRHGYTPRFVERCKALSRINETNLTTILDSEEEVAWVRSLAVRWGLTEANSHE